MSLKVRVRRQFKARSDRVKSVDLHPNHPWMLTALYDGTVCIWDIGSKKVVKSLSASELPVRAAKFVARKNWIITGSDDAAIRVFNYNTLVKVAHFTAHRDYIRSLAVHSSRPLLLTTADDGVIKLWNWEQKWACTQVFRGHAHIVMEANFNPKDNNQFASASLDRTVKIWQLGSTRPNFSLSHEFDVNSVNYHPGGDKPYLASGCDMGVVKIWDYQTKTCVQTLQDHAKDVNAVLFHPSLPLIVSGGSDGTLRMWHSSTYKLVATLNFSLERVWTLASQPGSNTLALGCDDGSMLIKLGREEPAISMDQSGKIVWAKHSELQQANVKAIGDLDLKDGERMPLSFKNMGSCEFYPQTIMHSPNGRFVSVCGDGEYTIYTAVALRSKAYGPGLELVWASNLPCVYAVREERVTRGRIKIFKSFKEQIVFKPDFGADAIYGGHLLGVRSSTTTGSWLAFYDWETAQLVRQIDTSKPLQVMWNDGGDLMALTTEESFYVLQYKPSLETGKEPNSGSQTASDVEGSQEQEDTFEVVKEVEETVTSGVWAGDCFIYTNSINRLNYYVGGEIVSISHLDRRMYVLGYLHKENRLYVGDKDLSVISFSLHVSILEYQTAVMRRDFVSADSVLPMIPSAHRARVAHFLEKQGFRKQAMSVTPVGDHKFDLALQLGDLHAAYTIVKQQHQQQRQQQHHEGSLLEKWRRLSDLALNKSEFGLAQECLYNAQDWAGLLLLATSAGNSELIARVAHGARSGGHSNIAFSANFVLGRCDNCLEILLETHRLPEAAFFARTYLPSQVARVVSLWKECLSLTLPRQAAALANPIKTVNLFPGWPQALELEREQTLNSKQHTAVTQSTTQQALKQEEAQMLSCKQHTAVTQSTTQQALKQEEAQTLSCKQHVAVTQSPTQISLTSDPRGDSGRTSKSSRTAPIFPQEDTTRPPLSAAAAGTSNQHHSSPTHRREDAMEGEDVEEVEEGFLKLKTYPMSSKPGSDMGSSAGTTTQKVTTIEPGNELSPLTLEEELALDLEGVNIDDFDMDDFEFDTDEDGEPI